MFPHATRRWAKKIRGKLHYFGAWDDPTGALQKYLDQRDDLQAGRVPRNKGDGITIRDLANRFLTGKRHLVDTSEITPRTFDDYHDTCGRIIEAFGAGRQVDDLATDDFERLRKVLSKTRGPVALGNEIQRIRVAFKYAYDAGLIKTPVRYGPGFKRSSRKVLRKARNEKGPRMFEAAEIRAMLRAASPQLRAMILLGVNCGLGNTDVGDLPQTDVDLRKGWINYPRPKTGIRRRCPLWPETIAALNEVRDIRPTPVDEADAELVFLTKYGDRWTKQTRDNPVSKETTKVLESLGIKRPGLSFYALRHTFETIGGESRDQVAVDHIMGHARDDMASVYRERISDERLRAVTGHVRQWLYAGATKDSPLGDDGKDLA
ncbi:MAG: tyrosine-type recombinase/integrase [Pirellulales bacterium]